MKKIRIILLVLSLLILYIDVTSANEKIMIAAFEYPPIYQNLQTKGLSGDIVVEAFKSQNIDAELYFYPVNRMVYKVSEGYFICGIGGKILFEGPDIKSKVTFSSLIQYVSQVFFYNSKRYPSGISFSNVKDMNKYKIGVLRNSGIHKYLKRDGITTFEENTFHEGSARQLQIGRIDVWAIVDLTGAMHLKSLFPEEYQHYKRTKAFNVGDVSLVFCKKLDPNNKYNNIFRAGLSKIKKDGTYMNLMAKYYGGKEKINIESLADDMR